MNSLVKVFSNFKEFYNEINGATLTGAIDVIVVEQPDGEFQCSPFHVRFGKLGVLRSREKVVDIEINGEPVDIHMKLGESGEAFFVEECPEEDLDIPSNLATSPIPTGFFPAAFDESTLTNDENSKELNAITASDEIKLPIPLPRRNSIDFSKEAPKDDDVPKYENQVSDFSHRRHTDNGMERRNLADKLKEYTTQKIRQEWAEHEEMFHFDAVEKDKEWVNSTQCEQKAISTALETKDIPVIDTSSSIAKTIEPTAGIEAVEAQGTDANSNQPNNLKEESKGKKKRRKKSQMKKKNSQRKSSSSSSLCSNPLDGATASSPNCDDADTVSLSLSNITNTSSTDESGTPKSSDLQSAPLVSARCENENSVDEEILMCQTSPITPSTRIPDLDIHFFSDAEVTSSGGNGPCGGARIAGRPSSPVQSDSELEISMREKETDVELMSNSASWKWGELPTPEASERICAGGEQNSQAQRNSMLSGMFNFMKITNKMRKQANDASGVYLSDLDTEHGNQELARYFPIPKKSIIETSNDSMPIPSPEDDRESGNGTSLPHSPSSMESPKSVDSDYDDGIKLTQEKYLDFVAMSLCGAAKDGEVPSDEEFDQHLVKYNDVCKNPSIFSSPNLYVRLNGKYYSWATACPIVMTTIIFQKPLSDDAIDQLMTNSKREAVAAAKHEADGSVVVDAVAGEAVGQAKRSWWYWRRSQSAVQANDDNSNLKNEAEAKDKVDGDHSVVATTQTTRSNTPDISEKTLSKTDSTVNAENTSAIVENLEDLSMASSKADTNIKHKNERYKKTLRLSSDSIKKLNLKEGMNEIEFSVTTAYQGTTRCKCYLFRWKHNDKVVISDIDGTITKSDVLGHILPMVGKDWAQLGVAELFSKIEQNGYKLLYLSARAIGQSRATREYLRSIRQGDVKLPDGPLLLNPTSLISAFHREVIERKPEQFKIACLSDIRELFPNKDPFYAGYGNRINDVWAYRAVGIPIMRIFTINTKGELKHELTQTFQSSGYLNQSLEIDEYFPFFDTNLYDDKTDIFDDDEEDELKFSETDNGDDDDEEEVFSDEYADDSIAIINGHIDVEVEHEFQDDQRLIVDATNQVTVNERSLMLNRNM